MFIHFYYNIKKLTLKTVFLNILVYVESNMRVKNTFCELNNQMRTRFK